MKGGSFVEAIASVMKGRKVSMELHKEKLKE